MATLTKPSTLLWLCFCLVLVVNLAVMCIPVFIKHSSSKPSVKSMDGLSYDVVKLIRSQLLQVDAGIQASVSHYRYPLETGLLFISLHHFDHGVHLGGIASKELIINRYSIGIYKQSHDDLDLVCFIVLTHAPSPQLVRIERLEIKGRAIIESYSLNSVKD